MWKPRFTTWSAQQEDVLAAALVGSHARGDARPESDIDLVVVVCAPVQRLTTTDWLRDFGPVRSFAAEDYGLVSALRTFYQDGTEIEFGIAPVEWCRPPVDASTARVIRDGIEILYDPFQMLAAGVRWVHRIPPG